MKTYFPHSQDVCGTCAEPSGLHISVDGKPVGEYHAVWDPGRGKLQPARQVPFLSLKVLDTSQCLATQLLAKDSRDDVEFTFSIYRIHRIPMGAANGCSLLWQAVQTSCGFAGYTKPHQQ